MRAAKREFVWALLLGVCCATGRPQAIISPIAPDVVLSTRFLTNLTYDASLKRLGAYYEEQVGRKLAVALPEIGPHRHFEVWHDMWAFFDEAGGQTAITLKRPTAGVAPLLVKTWMLDIAGRLEAPMPLTFKEEPAMHEAEGEVCASRSDLGRALVSEPSMKLVPTWEHAGLAISVSPLRSVMMAPSGTHGVHRITVAAESTAAAKQLLAKLMQGVLGPGICAAYSESAELERQIHNQASGKSAELGTSTAQTVYIPNLDEKRMEDQVRAEPEMVKRTTAAQGQYGIQFRMDGRQSKVTVRWLELAGYDRATSKYEAERELGLTVVPNPGQATPAGPPLAARTKLHMLNPGAYRVRLESQNAAGQTGKIDERTYWFDGKTFEEM